MNLGFGLFITFIGIISVFSLLTVVALVCVALKKLFKGKLVDETEGEPTEEQDIKTVEKTLAGIFKIKLDSEEHNVKIEDLRTVGMESEVKPPSRVGKELKIVVNDAEYEVAVEKLDKVNSEYYPAPRRTASTVKEATMQAKEVIVAPMQGAVVKVPVKIGDKVEKGSVVVVLETMKMENAIEGTVSGIVKKIQVSEGDSVRGGDILVIIG